MTHSAEPLDTAPYAEGFNHEPLRQRAANVIRDAILDGNLLPGSPLVEKTIAADLEISRAPVREAIRILSTEGLVESVPYKGSYVRGMSARDIKEIFSLRGLLERYAVESALASDPRPSLAPLEATCASMDAAAATDDQRALNEADRHFHRALIALADHELLMGTWLQIELRARHAMALCNGQLGDAKTIAANHRSIVGALGAGDLDRSLRLVTEHIASGAQVILDDMADEA